MLPAALAIAAAAGGAAWAVRGRSSPFFGPSVWHGDRSRRSLALTFDDGPSKSTPELLAALEELGVPATFFVCGAAALARPDVLRQAVRSGHEIGSHGHTHARLWLRPPEHVAREVGDAQEAIASITGTAPKLFRPAYGVRWFGLGRALHAHRLTTVMWSILGRDWTLDGSAVSRRVLSRARDGDIICLHDGRELAAAPDISSTIAAVRDIVPALRSRGFRFQTVSDLCPTTSTHA